MWLIRTFSFRPCPVLRPRLVVWTSSMLIRYRSYSHPASILLPKDPKIRSKRKVRLETLRLRNVDLADCPWQLCPPRILQLIEHAKFKKQATVENTEECTMLTEEAGNCHTEASYMMFVARRLLPDSERMMVSDVDHHQCDLQWSTNTHNPDMPYAPDMVQGFKVTHFERLYPCLSIDAQGLMHSFRGHFLSFPYLTVEGKKRDGDLAMAKIQSGESAYLMLLYLEELVDLPASSSTHRENIVLTIITRPGYAELRAHWAQLNSDGTIARVLRHTLGTWDLYTQFASARETIKVASNVIRNSTYESVCNAFHQASVRDLTEKSRHGFGE